MVFNDDIDEFCLLSEHLVIKFEYHNVSTQMNFLKKHYEEPKTDMQDEIRMWKEKCYELQNKAMAAGHIFGKI